MLDVAFLPPLALLLFLWISWMVMVIINCMAQRATVGALISWRAIVVRDFVVARLCLARLCMPARIYRRGFGLRAFDGSPSEPHLYGAPLLTLTRLYYYYYYLDSLGSRSSIWMLETQYMASTNLCNAVTTRLQFFIVLHGCTLPST